MNSETTVSEQKTPAVRSVVPSQILGPEESESMSSIESCVKQLGGLMSSAADSLKKDHPPSLTPQLISSASRCAGEISKLLRLKLEYIKYSRRTSNLPK